MKDVPIKEDPEDMMVIDEADREFSCCDWKANPRDVLELVDKLLEEHGLEVLMGDLEDDQYYFTIAKRE